MQYCTWPLYSTIYRHAYVLLVCLLVVCWNVAVVLFCIRKYWVSVAHGHCIVQYAVMLEYGMFVYY